MAYGSLVLAAKLRPSCLPGWIATHGNPTIFTGPVNIPSSDWRRGMPAMAKSSLLHAAAHAFGVYVEHIVY